MHSKNIVDLHVTANNLKILSCIKFYLGEIIMSASIKRNSFVVYSDIIANYNQQDALFLDLFISTDALHVSGGSSAHHQEHITVHTASVNVNRYC